MTTNSEILSARTVDHPPTKTNSLAIKLPEVDLGLDKPVADTRVVVAMSGGVDSSVVAALLHHAGYQVIGITLQLYDHGSATGRKGACCAGQDIHDARNVAVRLGFPHYVLDYESRFRDRVIEPFADAYINGETPVPCIACNQFVKFADLFETARDLGADALATGHYIASRSLQDGTKGLYRASDANRDQSYFLFTTTAEQLDFLRFPLGDLPKTQVRELADHFGLSIAEKPDSQDICFVPSGKYAQIIEKLRPDASEPGDILHIDGRKLGRHKGIIHYTIGQRRGLELTDHAATKGEPLYVVAIKADTHTIIVGPPEALAVNRVDLRAFNWIGDGKPADFPADGLPVAARVRSTRPPVPGRLYHRGGKTWVTLMDGETGVSPGQACVLYQDDSARARVLGGGYIQAS